MILGIIDSKHTIHPTSRWNWDSLALTYPSRRIITNENAAFFPEKPMVSQGMYNWRVLTLQDQVVPLQEVQRQRRVPLDSNQMPTSVPWQTERATIIFRYGSYPRNNWSTPVFGQHWQICNDDQADVAHRTWGGLQRSLRFSLLPSEGSRWRPGNVVGPSRKFLSHVCS